MIMYRIFFVIVVLVIDVSAKDFLVSNIKALHETMKNVRSGDVIIMKNGIWSDVNITFRAKGNETAPIILRAEEQGKVIISGKSSLRILGSYLKVDGLVFKNGQPSRKQLIRFGNKKHFTHHSRLTNVEIIDFNDINLSERYDWVVFFGGRYNRIDHCRFTQMKNKGVTLNVVLLDNTPANYHRIDHNEFSYRKMGKGNGYETIRVGNSKQSLQNSRTTIKKNFFLQCDGEGEIISNKSCENRYIQNTFMHSKGMLTLRHGNRCLVKDNFFFSNGHKKMGGVRIVGEGHKIINNYFEGVGGSAYTAAISFMNGIPHPPLNEYAKVKDSNITHNKFIYTKYTIVSGANYKKGRYTVPPGNIIFANNLIVGSKKPLPKYIGKVVPDIKYKNNIMFKSELNIKNLKGFKVLNPHIKKDKESKLWISHIRNDFEEKGIQAIKISNVGPQKETVR